MNHTHLHAAIAAHMAHGAMAGADPLTDTLLDLVDEASAAEGAQPPTTAGTALTALQRARLAEADADPVLYWLLPLGFSLALFGLAVADLLAANLPVL